MRARVHRAVRRGGAIALLAVALLAPQAHAHQAPFHPLDRILNDPILDQSHVGIEVRRLSGEVLYSYQANRLFTPASVVKLATTTAALRRLGPETRFKTELLADGVIADGTLPGNLYLKGYGDPTLRSEDLDAFVAALATNGVKHIAGDLVADASAFNGPRYPSGWMWDDLPYGFAAPTSALSLDGNAPLADPMRDAPEHRAAQRLRERLASVGIVLAGTVRVGRLAAPEATLLHRHWSPTLAEIVTRVNKESNNLLAETLVHHLGLLGGVSPALQATGTQAAGTHATGMAALKQALAELGWEEGEYRLADGSGLSRYDAVTPRQMTTLLTAAARMPEGATFLSSLPVAGLDGTLATRMVGSRAHGAIAAKTGTMSGVSSLCGYVLRPGREPVAFALMVNGFVGSAKPVQTVQDALMDALVSALD